ncbi:hypothetical protein HI914_00550 [Erysiphe necator]|uniref:Uncharacterized protein n=1 Tax=Uncinula necator TaxID=52586 RepID=A0A0B1P339_UNCNE|nr:hypothetical protein HI914_00550 [Erysiphe necator]KHJ31094.1 hypothetical protein EV44_g1299 [Erysiphe necator]
MSNNQSASGAGLSTSVSTYQDANQQLFDPSLDVWDEERFELAMKTLKEMHIQLRNLRTTIPRLLAPLTLQHHAPQMLLEEFKQSIKTANQEIQEFQQLMMSEESSKIFCRARKSLALNAKFNKPWSVTENPDWLTRGS